MEALRGANGEPVQADSSQSPPNEARSKSNQSALRGNKKSDKAQPDGSKCTRDTSDTDGVNDGRCTKKSKGKGTGVDMKGKGESKE